MQGIHHTLQSKKERKPICLPGKHHRPSMIQPLPVHDTAQLPSKPPSAQFPAAADGIPIPRQIIQHSTGPETKPHRDHCQLCRIRQ